MSHVITHPVNKTAHTGINQFHVASQVSNGLINPPGCQYWCGGNPIPQCSSQCPDGSCANGNSRCQQGTYLAGLCPQIPTGCDNPWPTK